MLKNSTINLGIVKEVARGLEELNERMVFVGGATVSLYANDPGAEEARPTADIDMTVEVAGFGEYAQLQERLSQLGFMPSPEDDIICRFRFNRQTKVDIMPAKDIAYGPTNPWYKPGFQYKISYPLDEDLSIYILPAPYFLATKFEAYASRGDADKRLDKDFEDIVYVLDNRVTIVDEILQAESKVKSYLQSQIKQQLEAPLLEEALEVHINPFTSADRIPMLISKMRSLLP